MIGARCEHCGYDVAGLTVEAGRALCPECGKSTPVASPAEPGLLRHAPWIILGVGSGPTVLLSVTLCCLCCLTSSTNEYRVAPWFAGLMKANFWTGVLFPFAVPFTLAWFDRPGRPKDHWAAMAGLCYVINGVLGVITFVFYYFSPFAPNC